VLCQVIKHIKGMPEPVDVIGWGGYTNLPSPKKSIFVEDFVRLVKDELQCQVCLNTLGLNHSQPTNM